MQNGKHVAFERLKASPPFLADLLFENSTYLSSRQVIQFRRAAAAHWMKFQMFFPQQPKAESTSATQPSS